jgi:hypothetical protein
VVQIKKVDFKQYERPKGGVKKLTKLGHCYYLFWSKYSSVGFYIPFTLRIDKRFDWIDKRFD